MKVVNGASGDDQAGKGFIAGGNDAFYKEIIVDLLSNANWLVNEIEQVESLIDFAANVLRYSQPKVESMVDVRWWKSQSTSDRKVPVLVKWKNAKTGKHAGELTVPKVLKRTEELYQGFPNWAISSAVLGQLRELIDYWYKLVNSLRDLRNSSSRTRHGFLSGGKAQGVNRDLYHSKIYLVALRDDLVKRLDSQGYGLPEEFLTSVPREV